MLLNFASLYPMFKNKAALFYIHLLVINIKHHLIYRSQDIVTCVSLASPTVKQLNYQDKFIKFLCIFKLGGNITNSIPDTSIWAIDVTSYKSILKSFLI